MREWWSWTNQSVVSGSTDYITAIPRRLYDLDAEALCVTVLNMFGRMCHVSLKLWPDQRKQSEVKSGLLLLLSLSVSLSQHSLIWTRGRASGARRQARLWHQATALSLSMYLANLTSCLPVCAYSSQPDVSKSALHTTPLFKNEKVLWVLTCRTNSSLMCYMTLAQH